MEVVRKCEKQRKLTGYMARHLWDWLHATICSELHDGCLGDWDFKQDTDRWKTMKANFICLHPSWWFYSPKLQRHPNVGVTWFPQLTVLIRYQAVLASSVLVAHLGWGTRKLVLIMVHNIEDAPFEPFLGHSFSLLRFPKVLRKCIRAIALPHCLFHSVDTGWLFPNKRGGKANGKKIRS